MVPAFFVPTHSGKKPHFALAFYPQLVRIRQVQQRRMGNTSFLDVGKRRRA